MELSYLIFQILTVSYISRAASVSEYKSYEGYKLFQVEGNIKGLRELIDDLKKGDESLIYIGNKSVGQVLVAPDWLEVFEQIADSANLKMKLLVGDYSKIIKEEKTRPLRGSDFSWIAYYDVDDIYNYLQNTSRTYPDWAELVVGGESYEGRQILGLKIDTEKREGKPIIFIESGIHAREWITPATTTYFINQLMTSSDPEVIALRDQFVWHIFPTVNPDGYHYSFKYDRMWRKTRSVSPNGCRGADPNRNWDYNWLKHGATSNPCDYQTYGGDYPFSEKETRTLAAYISGLENLQAYIAFHSYAQVLLLPYSDSVDHVDNYDDLVQIGKTSLEYGYKVNGETYDGPATAAEVLYKASGGSMDWVRHALGTSLVYTYELRGVYFYWPPSKIYQQGDEVTQMMVGLVAEAKNLGYF